MPETNAPPAAPPVEGTPCVEGWFTTEAPPALLGSACDECGTVVFPPGSGPCPNPRCTADLVGTRRLSTRGRIWSYTDARYQPPPPFIPMSDPYEPFTIAAVELADEAIVVLGQLVDGVGTDDVAVGDEVELVIAPLHVVDGETRVTWKWKPVGAAGEGKGSNDV